MMKTRSEAEHTARMKKLQTAQHKKFATKTVEKGLVIVNTGPGKGKSTAAFGMAIRSIAHGMKVGIVQFVKGSKDIGERSFFARFPDEIEFKSFGEGFTWDTQDRARDIELARAGWDEVKRMIADPSYRLIIADELNIILRYDYLPVDEVLEALAAKPEMTHIAITGRNAPQALIDAADLVTEMAMVKHPFRDQNVKAQAGIEF